MSKLGNIVSATKMFLNLLGNIFVPWEANFVSATMFPDVGKQGNIDRKHNVSATMFSSLPRAVNNKFGQTCIKFVDDLQQAVVVNKL